MRKAISAAVILLLVSLLGRPVAAQSDEDRAQVTIVHGIPGQTVDVYADETPLIAGLVPATTTKTFDLDEGDYTLALFSAGADIDADEPLVDADVTIEGETNITVVAHLDEEGEFAVSTFENDLDDIQAGDACVIGRHVAAAPEADILVDGEAALEGLSNGDSSDAVALDPGSIEVNVAAAGDDEGLLGSDVELTLAEGVCTIAYAIGSVEDENVSLLLQLVTGLESEPLGQIETGNWGLLNSDSSLPFGFILLIVAGIGGGTFAARSLATRN